MLKVESKSLYIPRLLLLTWTFVLWRKHGEENREREIEREDDDDEGEK